MIVVFTIDSGKITNITPNNTVVYLLFHVLDIDCH